MYHNSVQNNFRECEFQDKQSKKKSLMLSIETFFFGKETNLFSYFVWATLNWPLSSVLRRSTHQDLTYQAMPSQIYSLDERKNEVPLKMFQLETFSPNLFRVFFELLHWVCSEKEASKKCQTSGKVISKRSIIVIELLLCSTSKNRINKF